MSVIPDNVREFVESCDAGVFATIRRDGRARQTVANFVLDGDRILMSTEGQRFKSRDIENGGWASLCVIGSDKPHPSCTLEGPAVVRRTGIAADTGLIFSALTGGPAPVLTDEGLAAVDRVVVEISVERVYAIQHVKGTPSLVSKWAQSAGADAETADVDAASSDVGKRIVAAALAPGAAKGN
jgi:hypothetical protein